MKLIYNNFDGLDLTFQGILPESVLNQLAQAKEQAQQDGQDAYIKIGEPEIKIKVSATGKKGGFRYCFSTGIDGELWSISHSKNSKHWGLNVSVSSLGLAMKGYEGVRRGIINTLQCLNATGQSRLDSAGKVCNTPLERISRIDYCFDFIMDNPFEPVPKAFVAHQRSGKHIHGDKEVIPDYNAINGDVINTIRVGQMPNRQAVIYNKVKEIKAHSKQYWWRIWNLDKEILKQNKQTIWRVEIRAGKNELDKWGLKRFEDFESKAGDVIQHILKSIRYTEPLIGDNNRARWPMHPIWQKSFNTAQKALEPYSTNAIRENIIEDYRQNIVNGYRDRTIGNIIGLTASQGRSIDEIPIALQEIQSGVNMMLKMDKKRIEPKFEKKEKQFRFLK